MQSSLALQAPPETFCSQRPPEQTEPLPHSAFMLQDTPLRHAFAAGSQTRSPSHSSADAHALPSPPGAAQTPVLLQISPFTHSVVDAHGPPLALCSQVPATQRAPDPHSELAVHDTSGVHTLVDVGHTSPALHSLP